MVQNNFFMEEQNEKKEELTSQTKSIAATMASRLVARQDKLNEEKEQYKCTFISSKTNELMQTDEEIKTRAEAMQKLGTDMVKSYRNKGIELTVYQRDGKAYATKAIINVDYFREKGKEEPKIDVNGNKLYNNTIELRCNPYEDKSIAVSIKFQAKSNLDQEGKPVLSSVRSAEFKDRACIKSFDNINDIIAAYEGTGIDKALEAVSEKYNLNFSRLKKLEFELVSICNEGGEVLVPILSKDGKPEVDKNGLTQYTNKKDCYILERHPRDENGKDIAEETNGLYVRSHSNQQSRFTITENKRTGKFDIGFETYNPNYLNTVEKPSYNSDGKITPWYCDILEPTDLACIDFLAEISGDKLAEPVIECIAKTQGIDMNEYAQIKQNYINEIKQSMEQEQPKAEKSNENKKPTSPTAPKKSTAPVERD